MGASYVATAVVIGVSLILVIQTFTGSLLPSISDINSSYHDMKDRAIDQVQTDINITSVTDIGWWDPSWSSRKMIVINHSLIQEDQTDMPVLIYRSSDSELAAKAQADGQGHAKGGLWHGGCCGSILGQLAQPV